jgi:hypothetical protein
MTLGGSVAFAILPQTSRQVDSVPTATHTLQHNWRSTNRNTALRRSVRLPINAPEFFLFEIIRKI